VQDKKVIEIKAGCPSNCLSRVGQKFSLLPKAVENAIPDGATDSQDVVRAADGPEHARLFDALADHGFATGFR
jgi:hypothetical protein